MEVYCSLQKVMHINFLSKHNKIKPTSIIPPHEKISKLKYHKPMQFYYDLAVLQCCKWSPPCHKQSRMQLKDLSHKSTVGVPAQATVIIIAITLALLSGVTVYFISQI